MEFKEKMSLYTVDWTLSQVCMLLFSKNGEHTRFLSSVLQLGPEPPASTFLSPSKQAAALQTFWQGEGQSFSDPLECILPAQNEICFR